VTDDNLTKKLEETTDILNNRDNELNNIKKSINDNEKALIDANFKLEQTNEELNKEKQLKLDQEKAAAEALKNKDNEISSKIKENNLLSQQVLDKEKDLKLIQQDLMVEKNNLSQTLEKLENTEIEVETLKKRVSDSTISADKDSTVEQMKIENEDLNKQLLHKNKDLGNMKKE